MLSSLLFLCSCNSVDVNDFKSITNYNFKENDRSFQIDMDSVIINGIEAPTNKQIKGANFTFSFQCNQGSEKLYYKIYYQNEAYKFPEIIGDDTLNEISNENFYGSWGTNDDAGFKLIADNVETVTDSFRIAGNPRNERKFWGASMDEYQITNEQVAGFANFIKTQNVEWYKMIEQKAIANKMPLEQQLNLDAIFSLNMNRNKGRVNHKWKRNPRMGKYSAMLVVCTEADLNNIPEYVKDITQTHNDKYVNPFQYYLYGEGKNLKNTKVIVDTNFIVLKSKIDLAKGIFINKAEQQNEQFYTNLNVDCNDGQNKFRTAQVEQFFHTEIRDFGLNTVPIIADVLGNEYAINDYNEAEKNFQESQMVKDYIRSSNCPCKTVSVNKKEKSIQIYNPKSDNIANAHKENVGIKTRVGYTYGKFTAKIKFPPLINKTNVWTGLTNAFWMLYQDKNKWNYRRVSKTGYTEKGSYAADAPRMPDTYYSEIDFEIVKTSKYWPENYYNKKNPPIEDAKNNRDVVVGLTNWDLCNKDPKNYFHGIDTIVHGNKNYEALRWADYYQALTSRQGVSNDEMFNGDFYYFQIEWNPTEIIWRIGPDKGHMREIGFMNEDVTSIPNNQMIMIVTQEYHLSSWWPPIPFKQEYIPFLKKDMVGKIYDFEIE